MGLIDDSVHTKIPLDDYSLMSTSNDGIHRRLTKYAEWVGNAICDYSRVTLRTWNLVWFTHSSSGIKM